MRLPHFGEESSSGVFVSMLADSSVVVVTGISYAFGAGFSPQAESMEQSMTTTKVRMIPLMCNVFWLFILVSLHSNIRLL